MRPTPQSLYSLKVILTARAHGAKVLLKVRLFSDCKLPPTFVIHYWILLFLLCFVTPVLVTTSLNTFIHSAVHNTTFEVSKTNRVFTRMLKSQSCRNSNVWPFSAHTLILYVQIGICLVTFLLLNCLTKRIQMIFHCGY